jgi:lipopolysaccharide transport system permease protein
MSSDPIDSSNLSPFVLKEILIEPPKSWFSLRLREVWAYRELLFFFVWRDIKVRYKQTVLGVTWAVLQPLLTMVLFSFVFGKLAKIPTDGIPYPIFSYAGLLPWQLFSRTITDSATSLVNNQNMVTKIFFPRLILPLSSGLSGLVDFGIALLILFGLMVYYSTIPTWRILLLPFLVIITILTSTSVGLWLSALAVRYRDIKFITPFIVQAWLFITPVAYSSSLIPQKWQWLYNLNPMTGVVDGFRWILFGQASNFNNMIFISIGVVVFIGVTGLIFFQRMELTFADKI